MRTRSTSFLQMFVGSCAHNHINTNANAPHYKSAGTCCLVAFLHNYKAAHCDAFFRSFFVSYAAFTRHVYVRVALLSVVGWVAWKGSAALHHGKHVVIPSSFNFSPNFYRLLGRSVRHGTIHNGYWDMLSTVFGYGCAHGDNWTLDTMVVVAICGWVQYNHKR